MHLRNMTLILEEQTTGARVLCTPTITIQGAESMLTAGRDASKRATATHNPAHSPKSSTHTDAPWGQWPLRFGPRLWGGCHAQSAIITSTVFISRCVHARNQGFEGFFSLKR